MEWQLSVGLIASEFQSDFLVGQSGTKSAFRFSVITAIYCNLVLKTVAISPQGIFPLSSSMHK